MRRRDVTLARLHGNNYGPMLSPIDLARILGGSFTAEKIRSDIEAGHLIAVPVKCSTRIYWRIDWHEAQRYTRPYVPHGTVQEVA
jgi:hypothetical protein